jgi:hypothetical protein
MDHCAYRIALSGILEGQVGDIRHAYATRFDLQIADREDGWILVTGDRW